MKQARTAGYLGRRSVAHHWRAPCVAFALMSLTGCAALEYLDTMGDGDNAANNPAATFDPALADSDRPATGDASPRAKPAPPEPDDLRVRRGPLNLDSTSLVGLSESDAELLFGAPHFVIRQQPATRWHFVSQACTLDLFFFEDLETRERRILAYDVGTAAPRQASEKGEDGLNACANSIRAERNDSTS